LIAGCTPVPDGLADPLATVGALDSTPITDDAVKIAAIARAFTLADLIVAVFRLLGLSLGRLWPLCLGWGLQA